MAERTIEQMIDDLKAAGWVKAFTHVWQSPSGALFYGPAGAWRRMKDFPRLNVRRKRKEVSIVPTSEGL